MTLMTTHCRFCNAPLVIFDTAAHTEDGETDPPIPAETKGDLLKALLQIAVDAINEDNLSFAASTAVIASGFAQSEMHELAVHECAES